MKQLTPIPAFIVLLLCSNISWATDIRECEDELGERSFQKYCPAGSKFLGEITYSGKSPKSKVVLPALVLYSVPECEVCDLTRSDLSEKNIAFTEKNIKDNGELQLELKTKTGGELRVPVLLIGEQVITGYDAANLKIALTKAGYIVEDNPEE
ncbi:MAG: glutaredoxin [Gammaproteobacteria bacterium]|jgi:glutaredoxin